MGEVRDTCQPKCDGGIGSKNEAVQSPDPPIVVKANCPVKVDSQKGSAASSVVRNFDGGR